MITLVTNTTNVIQLTAFPFTDVVLRRGKEVSVLAIPCSPDMSLESIKETFSNETNTVSMILMDNGSEVRRYADYIKMEEISMVAPDVDEDGKNVPGYFVVKLSQKVTFEEELLTMKQTMGEIRKGITEVSTEVENQNKAIETLDKKAETINERISTVQESMSGVDPEKLDLPELKEYLIGQSKMALADYLENNPITSAVHGGVVKQYSITAEKQSYLMAMVLMAQNMEEARLAGMKQYYDAQYTEEGSISFEEFVEGVEAGAILTNGVTFNKYQPSWNAVGEPCTYDWTINELKQLAAEIEQTVRPLVSKQQTMEVNIKAARSIEEAKAVNLSFDKAVKMRA